jgi:hypothetical protein
MCSLGAGWKTLGETFLVPTDYKSKCLRPLQLVRPGESAATGANGPRGEASKHAQDGRVRRSWFTLWRCRVACTEPSWLSFFLQETRR